MDKILLKQRIKEILEKEGYIRVSNLAKEFGVTESNMNIALKKEGYREKDIFIQLPKNYIKNFEIIDEEASYWLGYIQADGCIYTNKNHSRLILECKEEDKELLINFCKFTKINQRRIKPTTHQNEKSVSHAVRLDLYENCFTVFPSKWISENKSKIDTELPKDVKFYDYLLGLVDGDGGFYKGQKGSQLQLLCRKPMLDQIIEQLKQDLPIPTSIWTKQHPRTNGLFILIIGNGQNNQNFKFLYNKFYNNKNYKSLIRKKENLEKILV